MDGWLHLPPARFSERSPEAHFYRNAIRWDALFRELALPLKRVPIARVEASQVEEASTGYFRRTFEFQDVDVTLPEGSSCSGRTCAPAASSPYGWTALSGPPWSVP